MSARVLAAVIAVVFAIAGGLAWSATSRGAKPPTRSAYLAEARAICEEYNKDLDRIPPIQDPTLLGVVIESVNDALPLLREQSYRIHSLAAPPALRAEVGRFFVLTDRSIDTLATVRDAAVGMNTGDVAVRLIRYGRQADAAKRIGSRIGYRC
jgi:hypothetical protein